MQTHTATQTLCGCTNPKALNAPMDKETQIHSGSEMHRHWSTDATMKVRTADPQGRDPQVLNERHRDRHKKKHTGRGSQTHQ